MPFRPVRNRTPGQGAMTGRRRGPRPRRAVFAATVTRASVRLAPAAILLSARQQVGTDVTGPNSSSWSPTTRKSLITSAPSAIAQARSAINHAAPVMDHVAKRYRLT